MRCLALRRTICLSRRTLSTSSLVCAKSVTKRKYQELPTVYTLADGSEAAPLDEIDAAIPKKKTRTRVSTKKRAIPEAIDESGDAAIAAKLDEQDSDEHKHKSISSVDHANSKENSHVQLNENGIITASDVDPAKSVSKPKRPRKKAVVRSADEGDSDGDHVPTDNIMPQSNLAREIQQNMARFPHCLLLTRVGQFYESYFHQAPILASLLDIKLTSRAWGQKGSRVHMCGFPLVHLDRHLKALVQQHKRFVAMCEEFPRPPGSEPGFDRRVTRVVTPGTLIDESFLNQYENNYLLAIGRSPDTAVSADPDTLHHDGELGLAWIDISTGEFFTQPTSSFTLRNDLARIAPKEVVLHESMRGSLGHAVRDMIGEELGWISYISLDDPPAPGVSDQTAAGGKPVNEDDAELSDRVVPVSPSIPHNVTTHIPIDENGELLRTESDDVPASLLPSTRPVDEAFTPSENFAVDLLTTYLRTNLLELMPRLSAPIREAHEERMQIDSHTIKALEIREGIAQGGTTGSLLSVVKRTITTSGTRLLARWLCSPSTSLNQIEARQSLVALFQTRQHLRSDLEEFLHQIEDASRIVQKFLLGRGDANDLLAIKDTINVTDQIKVRVSQERDLELQASSERAPEWQNIGILLDRMRDLKALAERIDHAVDESEFRRRERAALGASPDEEDEDGSPDTAAIPIQGPTPKPEGIVWTIKPDFSPELRRLHGRLQRLNQRKEELEQELKQTFSAPSLQLRLSFNHGLHIRIGNPRRDSAKIGASETAVLIGQSASSKSFFYPAWSQLGAEIAETEQSIQQAERRAFESLRSEVNTHATSLRRNARIVDEIDVTIGFANAADELRLIRPQMNDGPAYNVKNGRHPTVELGLLDAGRVFTANSVNITPTSRLHIITGPNMAGKSTLLRQTALIAILAQTGSFVPADRAEIGIVDKVFSRVGAKDDLFRDRSTFMVEMLETSEILRSATERSLVIMDEVGRGTTVADGLAIAFATVNHLYNINRSRSLFATHFHELADMLGFLDQKLDGEIETAFPHVGFFCTDVDEIEDGRFAYSHRLRPGVNRDSHGLKVAQLAGMPENAMAIASQALDYLRIRRGKGNAAELRVLGATLAKK